MATRPEIADPAVDELKRRAASPKPAKPAKPPNPPVDPDSEVARLRKSNSELRGRLRTMAGVYAEEIRNKRELMMPSRT